MPTHERSEHLWIALCTCVLLALTVAPYAVAWLGAPQGLVFTGVLYNPWDGHSYLAKMRQGWDGQWLFHLPFTEEPHDGAFIFAFYLALGHAARALGLSLPLTFHLARVLASAFMFAMLWRLLGRFFAGPMRRRAFLLTALGAGLGWLFPTTAPLLPDLWIPEAFAFYSALSNPHFPLALGLMAALADMSLADGGRRRLLGAAACGLAMAVVQPLALPVILAVLAAYALAQALRRREWRGALGAAAAAGVAGAPVLAYDLWVYRANPALAAWSAQNVTVSPPAWHWLAGYGLLAALAGVGLWAALRHSPSPLDLAAVWVGVAAVGMYIPFALQRRFSIGLGIPMGILAAAGFGALVDKAKPRLGNALFAVVQGLVSLSAVFLLVLGIAGAVGGEPRVFVSADEAHALTALRDVGGGRGVVAASPALSTIVPGWAGNPVVYGHPYETIRAEEKKAALERFFAQADDAARRRFLAEHRVAFVLWGPRERAMASDFSPERLGLRLVARCGVVEVWATGERP
ncbi:MAG: hypothetical protein Kow00123_19680 [Anaerolineales bacterium]